MIRPLAAVLSVALCAAAPPGNAPDRIPALAGSSWTCRDPAGALSTLSFSQADSAITADEKARDGRSIAHERFEPDPAGGWRVTHATANTTFTGHAQAWTAPSLVADGHYAYTFSRATTASVTEMRFDLLDDTTLRRTLAFGGREPSSGVVCAKGSAPPEPSLCAVHDLPGTTLRAVMPDTPAMARQQGIAGTVQVLVSLDADSRVVDATIQHSPAPILNASSLASAMKATFRTAIHDCKPVPSKYLYSIEYSD